MSGHHIIRASDELDFGLKAKQAFQAAMTGIADLPRIVLPTGSTPKPFYWTLKRRWADTPILLPTIG